MRFLFRLVFFHMFVCIVRRPSLRLSLSAAEKKRHGIRFFLTSHVLGGQSGQIGDTGSRAPSGGLGGRHRCAAERHRGDGKDSSLLGSRCVSESQERRTER